MLVINFIHALWGNITCLVFSWLNRCASFNSWKNNLYSTYLIRNNEKIREIKTFCKIIFSLVKFRYLLSLINVAPLLRCFWVLRNKQVKSKYAVFLFYYSNVSIHTRKSVELNLILALWNQSNRTHAPIEVFSQVNIVAERHYLEQKE